MWPYPRWVLAAFASLGLAANAQAAPPDVDRDGVPDPIDNCAGVANASQLDGDDDGFGNACDPDLDQDGVVDGDDVDVFALCFLSTGDATCDLDGNGIANFDDLAILRAGFRRPAGPKGRGPTVLVESSPRPGENQVAPSRETILRFSHPLDPSSISAASVRASAAGEPLSADRYLSTDRRSLTLFYDELLPPSTAVVVELDGALLRDADELGVDVDRDGEPGGTRRLEFETLATQVIASTAVCGRVFASELSETPGGPAVNTPLPGVRITVDGAEDTLFAVTDANGSFRLEPAPAGRFFVHVDGATATVPVPPGAYYPTVGKSWTSVPGREINVGEVYLPLVPPETLQPVSATADTVITFPPSVLAEHPELVGVAITVPAGSLFADDGTPGGSVGIAPVPPDRLPGPLPDTLRFPLVITVQTDGAGNFDAPAPICFPNLPLPLTNETLPPGAATGLWSFNHDTGFFEAVGGATVTPDGALACTDPGVGIPAPGWHSVDPGSPGGGGGPGLPGPGPPFGDNGDNGGDEEDDEELRPGDEPDPKCPKTVERAIQLHGTCHIQAVADRTNCVFSGSWLDFCDGPIDRYLCDRRGVLGDDSVTCARTVENQYENCHEFYAACATTLPFGDIAGDPPSERVFARAAVSAPPITPIGIPILDELTELVTELLHDDLATLPLEDQIRAIIGNATSDEELSPAQLAALAPLQQALTDRMGGMSARLYFGPREQRVLDLLRLLDREAGIDLFSDSESFFLLENLDTPFVQRGRTDPGGAIANLRLAPLTRYRLRLLDPATFRYGQALFFSSQAARRTTIPYVGRTYGPDPDDDGDGLSTRAEEVVGTSTTLPDTDGDGVLDPAEIAQGTDPFDGIPVAVGALAVAPVPGVASDVCASDDLVAVAGGASGVSIFSIFNGMNPTLLARVPIADEARRVACEGGRVVVAGASRFLSIIDASDPAAANVTATLDLLQDIAAVATDGPYAYAVTERDVVLVDLEAGVVLDRERYGVDGVLRGAAIAGGHLYFVEAMDGATGPHVVHKVATGSLLFDPVASLSIDRRATDRVGIAAGDGLVYVGGIATTQSGLAFEGVEILADLGATLALRANPLPIWAQDVAVNGSGLALFTGGNVVGAADLGILDVGTPASPIFLGLLDTVGVSRAVAIFNGLAYTAEESDGLLVTNYLASDMAGVPPLISLAATPQIGAGQVEEGQLLRLEASVEDDVQVRNVEFYVDGRRVRTDGGFPFELALRIPLRSDATSLTVEARASDTGGNAVWSGPLALSIEPDTTPPAILKRTLGDGDTLNSGVPFSLRVAFSEALDASTLDAATFYLVEAGPDTVFGTLDDVVHAGVVRYLAELDTALADFPGLPPGFYGVVVSGTVRDRAGNAIGTDSFWTIESRDTVRWISDQSGNWDDPTHWSGGQVPLAGDRVEIDRPGVAITVTHRSGSTTVLNALRCEESLTIQGGSFRVDDAESTIAGNLSITGSTPVFTPPTRLVVDGSTLLTGGPRIVGPGTLELRGSTQLGNHRLESGARVELHGGATVTTGIGVGDGVILNMAGSTLTASVGGLIRVSVVNQGTLVSRANAGAEFFFEHFVNDGSVRVETGKLRAALDESSGDIEILAGATFEVWRGGQLPLLAPGSSVSGAGTFAISAPLRVSGSYDVTGATVSQVSINLSSDEARFDGPIGNVGALTVSGPTFFDDDATASSYLQTTSRFGGSGTLTVTGLTTWNGGTIQGAGALIAAGGISMTSGTSQVLNQRTLENRGTWTWSAGEVQPQANALIRNTATGVIDVQGDGDFAVVGGHTARLENEGLIQKSGGSFPFQFRGAFTQLVSGTLRMRISGTIAGSGYDSFNFRDATLAGTLAIDASALVPVLGQRFDLFPSLVSRTGSFATVTGADLGGGLALELDESSPTKLSLEVVDAP